MRPNTPHTDSAIVEHHEDGSWTTTTVVTERPATRAEKAQAWGMLGGLTLVSFAPLLIVVAAEKLEARRTRKELAKKDHLSVVKDD